MRLIDADKLRERMYHDAFEVDSDMQKWDAGCWIRYKMFENAIDDAPTVDPVKHGYWVKDDEGDFHCSLCKAIVESDEQYRHYWRYCYHCGAKMEVEAMYNEIG